MDLRPGRAAREALGLLWVLAACGGAELRGQLASPADAGLERDADARATSADTGPAADAGRPPSRDADLARPLDASPAPPQCGDGTCEAPAETCGGCAADCGACGWPEEFARSEEAVLAQVNALRARGATCGGATLPAVPPLTMNAELRQAARLHSADMATNDYFDHTSQDGRSFGQRAAEAGYRGAPVGENIAAGSAGADATFAQWLNSPGHCQNMMSARAREIGIGHAFDDGARYGHYWTQVFGAR